jgi:hypothetical protein
MKLQLAGWMYAIVGNPDFSSPGHSLLLFLRDFSTTM